MLLKAPDLPGEPGNLMHSQVPDFEVDFAYQGQDGLALVEKSLGWQQHACRNLL